MKGKNRVSCGERKSQMWLVCTCTRLYMHKCSIKRNSGALNLMHRCLFSFSGKPFTVICKHYSIAEFDWLMLLKPPESDAFYDLELCVFWRGDSLLYGLFRISFSIFLLCLLLCKINKPGQTWSLGSSCASLLTPQTIIESMKKGKILRCKHKRQNH